MTSLNVGEYGNTLRFNVKEDVSGADSYSMDLKDRENNTITVIPTLGTTTVDTDRGTFPANEYVEYIFEAGDIDNNGWWKAQVAVQYTSKLLKSDWARFQVKP